MISTIIIISITILCMSAIVLIVYRHWNAISAIDLNVLPQERDARIKKKIISQRLQRQYHKIRSKWDVAIAPLAAFVRTRRNRVGDSLRPLFDSLHPQRYQGGVDSAGGMQIPPARTDKELDEAQRLRLEGAFQEAEKRYVDIIARDAKNFEAYEGLAYLYRDKKEWESAEEVLEFLCTHLRDQIGKGSLAPVQKAAAEARLAESLKALAEVSLMLENNDSAERSLREALDLQPQNPKFLDAGVEMYIILGKKREARAALSRLRDTNPDNQKLSEFETRIDNL